MTHKTRRYFLQVDMVRRDALRRQEEVDSLADLIDSGIGLFSLAHSSSLSAAYMGARRRYSERSHQGSGIGAQERYDRGR